MRPVEEFDAAIVRPFHRNENRSSDVNRRFKSQTSDVFCGKSLQLWIEIPDIPPDVKPAFRLLTRAHPCEQVVTAVHAQFLVDVVQVGLDRRQRDEQFAGDIRVALPLHDLEDQFPLAFSDTIFGEEFRGDFIAPQWHRNENRSSDVI